MNLLSSLLAFTARQIGALRTQADSNTSRIETSEGNITDLTTTVNNTIVANSNSKEVLWTGELYDDTITLSKNISNFDFIDIEYTQAVSSSTTRKTITKRIPAVAGSYEINDFAVTYDNPSIDFYKQTLTLSATSLVAAQNYNVEAASGSNTWITQRGTYQFAIVRVLGVKLGSASPSELTDIRVGADGVTYNSAGAAVRGQLSALKSDFTYLENYLGSAFISNDVLSAGETVLGSYVKKDGSISTSYSMLNYMAVSVPSNKIGYTYKVTGSAWYEIVPYVFVASDSTIVYADVPNPQSTLTQYTDLEFIPKKAGTLYINWHNDNNHGLTIKEINNLKGSMLPSELMDFDGYSQLSLTTQSSKMLNGATGAIVDSTYPNAKVSSAIPITGGKAYLITAEHFYGNGLYAFYDSSMNFIAGRNSENSGNMTIMRFEKVMAPIDAAYLVVANWNNLFSEPYVAEGNNIVYATKKWINKKWACIGDSLTGSGTYNYRHYYDFVSECTGISPAILGVGGTGYVVGSTPFYTQALSVPQDADVITIFGSFNDLSSALPIGSVDDSGTSTIAGCINKTIENILSVIPTANIGIVFPCPWSTTQPTDTGNAYNYVSMLKAICDRNSLPYLDLWHHSGLMPWNEDFASETYPTGDRVHPNEKGHAILATKFKAFLETLLF